jgi:hypothetical protein
MNEIIRTPGERGDANNDTNEYLADITQKRSASIVRLFPSLRYWPRSTTPERGHSLFQVAANRRLLAGEPHRQCQQEARLEVQGIEFSLDHHVLGCMSWFICRLNGCACQAVTAHEKA